MVTGVLGVAIPGLWAVVRASPASRDPADNVGGRGPEPRVDGQLLWPTLATRILLLERGFLAKSPRRTAVSYTHLTLPTTSRV